MQFCTGEDDEDTNCCLFEAKNFTQKRQSNQSREICGWGSKLRSHQKAMNIFQKQTRLISKIHRKQKSQQKGKTSLSKVSGKRGNYSKDHCESKPISVPVEKPHSSAPKSHFIQNQHVQSVKFSQQKIQALKLPQKIHQSIQSGKIKPNSVHTYQNVYSSHQKVPQQYMVSSNYPQFENNNPSPFHYIVQKPNQYRFLPERRQADLFSNVNQHEMTLNINQHHQIRLHHLRNHGSQVSNVQNYPKNQQSLQINESFCKNNKIIMPTLETDRIMEGSQEKSIASRLKYSSMHQSCQTQQAATIPKDHRHEINFGQSRYTEHSSLQLLGQRHLKTVHSVLSEEAHPKNEINQSIILVDYFNPSESVRREIQQKMHHRYMINMNNFGL